MSTGRTTATAPRTTPADVAANLSHGTGRAGGVPTLSDGTGSLLGAWLGRVRPAVAGALLAAAVLPGCSVLGPGVPLDEISIAEPLPRTVEERLAREASPLFAKIVAEARRLPGADLVPGDVAVTFDNRAEHVVAIEPERIYATAARLIARAEREIVIQTFAFDVASDPARLVFDALAEKARAHAREHPGAPPIVVRVLVDAMPLGLNGNLPTDRLLASIERRVHALGTDPRHLAFDVGAYEHTLVGSSHAKLVGIDGETFLVTGANFAPDNAFGRGEHDAGFVVEGSVGRALRASFEVLRTSPATRHVTIGAVPREAPAAAAIGANAPVADAPAAKTPSSPMAVFAKPPNDRIFSRHERYTLDHALVAAFRGATEGIDLQTPNLNAATLKREVLDAVGRGETVRLVLSKHYEDRSEWVPGQGGTNQTTVDALYDALEAQGLSAEERCARLQIRWYSHDGRAPVEGHDPHASHVKLYAFRGDGGDLVVFVGSLNLDTQSWAHSGEVLVAVDDDTVARAWLDQLFERDFARSVPVEACTAGR
ncbi:phospholipase D-like domain-containing protein [Myxococcota bacterium]|nr:phospholipase D-like domain-containing protein [Myxococcota bacterium]